MKGIEWGKNNITVQSSLPIRAININFATCVYYS